MKYLYYLTQKYMNVKIKFKSHNNSENNNLLKNGPTEFENLSDKNLYDYCRKAGFNAIGWSRKFIATIPEVAKRRLYKKYGYCSIREFASKLAGVSHDNVDEALRVSEKFKELPRMKALIGEVGLSKLRVVACIVNKENEMEIAEKVKNMTKSSLEIYVREKYGKSEKNRNSSLPGEGFASTENSQKPQAQGQIGLFENGSEDGMKVANPRSHDKKTFTIQIDDETEFELRKFKQKLEKERKEPIDWNFALKEIVKRAIGEQMFDQNKSRKSASASEPRTESKNLTSKPKGELAQNSQTHVVSRYIPAKIKHALQQKYNGHCAYRGCNKPAEQIHHQDGFAKKHTHENLVPLCKTHHDFVHQIIIDKLFNAFKMKFCTRNIL